MNGHIKIAWILAQQDLRAKYLRSKAGLFWFFATPIAFFAIYYVVFGAAFKIGYGSSAGGGVHSHMKGGLPFFVGLTVYLYVSDTVTSSLALFDSKRSLIRKMPFPLWVIWLATQLRVAVKAGVYLAVVIVLSLFAAIVPGSQDASAASGHLTVHGLAFLLPSILLTVLFCSGLSLLLSSVAPFIGDVREPTQIIMRVLFYVTPVVYPVSMVPERIVHLLWLNPITHMIEMVRNALLHESIGTLPHVVGFTAVAIVICSVGVWIFARLEGTIHDVV